MLNAKISSCPGRDREVLGDPLFKLSSDVGPPKDKVGRPKQNMMIVDAKSSEHKSILTFLSKCS